MSAVFDKPTKVAWPETYGELVTSLKRDMIATGMWEESEALIERDKREGSPMDYYGDGLL